MIVICEKNGTKTMHSLSSEEISTLEIFLFICPLESDLK